MRLFSASANVILIIALLLPASAYAIGVCSVTATGPSVTYDSANASPTNGAGNVTVNCTLIGVISVGVSYQINLSTGSSNNYSQRHLNYLSNQLNYNLYRDAARSLVWGDGSAGTVVVNDGYTLGIGVVVRNYPVYSQLPASQNVPAGVYNDTINVTLVY